jgi:hypothetical protein
MVVVASGWCCRPAVCLAGRGEVVSEKKIWYEVEQKHPQWGWRRTIGSSDTLDVAKAKASEMIGETRIIEITRTRRITTQ